MGSLDKEPVSSGAPSTSSGPISIDPETGKINVPYNLDDELGTTGTKIFSGVIDEEYQKDWRLLRKRCDVIDRMKADATIKALLLAIELPILGSRWDVREPRDAKESRATGSPGGGRVNRTTVRERSKHAEFIYRNFFQQVMDHSWDYFMRHAMASVAYGFMPFEKVY